jgi:hypothetical protein
VIAVADMTNDELMALRKEVEDERNKRIHELRVKQTEELKKLGWVEYQQGMNPGLLGQR